jgi:hypothetical protein
MRPTGKLLVVRPPALAAAGRLLIAPRALPDQRAWATESAWYFVPSKALLQTPTSSGFPASISTTAVPASTLTSPTDLIPGTFERAARTRAAQPEGQVMPLTATT